MDQIKIGRFIAERRKQNNFTQAQLAEQLGITDRAVSKWERGKSMPDSSIMLDLCDALKINVKDLLCGEIVSVNNYDEKNEKLEKNLLDMVKQKERSDKQLLRSEVLMLLLSIGFLLALIEISYLIKVPGWIMAIGIAQLLIVSFFAIRIEQIAGYYQCSQCGHKHIPKYVSLCCRKPLFRARRLTCPKCGERSWHKKVVSLDKKNRKEKNNE